MDNERIKILDMLQSGKVTSSEALELLKALDLDGNQERIYPTSKFANRFFRVRVDGEKTKVNVNVPLNLVKATSRLIGSSMKFIPEEARREMAKKGIDLSQLDMEELIRTIDEELVNGKIVDVEVDDPKEGRMKVEVYVD